MAGRRNDVSTGLRVSTKDGTEIPYPSAPSSTETNRTVESERPFLVSSDDFVKRVMPIAEEHLRRLNLTQLGDQPVNPDAVRVRPNAPQFQGSNYTAQIATINGRPHLLVQREDGQLFAKPVEQFLDIRQWFNPHLVPVDSSKSETKAPASGETPSPTADASGQSQQRPMNIFEYMEKLPPQERLVFTILLYLLISETMGRIFQRGGGNRQSPPIAWQTPWMPGPPKGQQWMIWG